MVGGWIQADVIPGFDVGSIIFEASGGFEAILAVVNDVVIDFYFIFELDSNPDRAIDDDILINLIAAFIAEGVIAALERDSVSGVAAELVAVLDEVSSDDGVCECLVREGIGTDGHSTVVAVVMLDEVIASSLNPHRMSVSVLKRSPHSEVVDGISSKGTVGGGVIRVADNIDSVAGMGNVTIDDFHIMATIVKGKNCVAAIVHSASLPSYMMGIIGTGDAVAHGIEFQVEIGDVGFPASVDEIVSVEGKVESSGGIPVIRAVDVDF